VAGAAGIWKGQIYELRVHATKGQAHGLPKSMG